MTDEPKVQENNNPEDSQTTEPQVSADVTTDEPKVDEGANQQAVSEPEFEDENMQKAWTQKTQALAEERKKFEESQKQWETQQEAVNKKLQLFDRMDKDQAIVDFVSKHWGGNTDEPKEITEDDLYAAQTDPQKLREIIQIEARKEAMKLNQPVSQQMRALKVEGEIHNYANQTDNKDFWDLDQKGLIQPHVALLKQTNPHMDDVDMFKEAHLKARELVNSVAHSIREQESARVNSAIQEKKDGSINKGGKSHVPSLDTAKGKSITEIGEALVNKSGG